MLNFPLARAIRTTTAVTLALILNHFTPSPTPWLPITAALLSQNELGFPLHQSMRRFFWILVIFFIGAQARLWLSSPLNLALLLTTATFITAYSYAYTSRRYLGLHFSLLLLIVFLLIALMPLNWLGKAAFTDILLGALLGLGSTLLIFPDKPEQEFPKRVTPLLKDLGEYLNTLFALILRDPQSVRKSQHQRLLVEKRWANKDDYFPVWVLEAGFNPELRAGQYYFIVHLSQITEILFSMQHFASHPFSEGLLHPFAPALRACEAHTQDLITQLIALLKGKKVTISKLDYLQDIDALEENFRSTLQLSLELLDISRDYVYLAAFIRYLKDLRLQLLQLAGTLNGPQQQDL